MKLKKKLKLFTTFKFTPKFTNKIYFIHQQIKNNIKKAEVLTSVCAGFKINFLAPFEISTTPLINQQKIILDFGTNEKKTKPSFLFFRVDSLMIFMENLSIKLVVTPVLIFLL